MATLDEKNSLLQAMHNCMIACHEKASDTNLPMILRNVFVTANIHLIGLAGQLHLQSPVNLDSGLIAKAIQQLREATGATSGAQDESSVGFAAIQLNEAIWACQLVLNGGL